MTPREELRKLAGEAKSIADTADARPSKAFTPAEMTRVAEIKARADELRKHLNAASAAEDLLADLAKDVDDDDVDDYDPLAGGYRKARATSGSRWAKAVLGKMQAASSGMGTKALLSGQVDTPPAVEVVELPSVPTRLLDLVAREELNEHTFQYLRQVTRTNNAAVVADGALKPTSTSTFEEIEDRARVIAHLSEPFPLRYLSDHKSMVDVLDGEMVLGVIEALEDELVNGDGTGEHFAGIFSTSGVTQVPYATDVLTTIRRARTTLGNKGENPTAWVFNPTDLETFDLMREDGATGGFLLDSTAAATIFGTMPRIPSPAVPVGTALLADWRTIRIPVRQGAHTLAATQAGDLFDTNRVKLRSEGRFGLKIKRPQAVAVVDLTAA